MFHKVHRSVNGGLLKKGRYRVVHLRIKVYIYTRNNDFVCISVINVLKDVLLAKQWGVFLGAPPKLVQELQHKKYFFFIAG